MRTGPFSNASVISRLNASFIPVYAVNEDYREGGPADPAEKERYLAIYREALDKGFSAGTVHVYVLNPLGQVIGTRHVADAAKTDELIQFLDEITARLETKTGERILEPRPQSVAPSCEQDSLVLHLVARSLGGGGSWDGTAEDWIIYSPQESRGFVQHDAQIGDSWTPPADLAERLLKHVYPVTENNDISKNEILEQRIRITRLPDRDGLRQARIDGYLRMRHDFYHKPDGKVVETHLLGYFEWDSTTELVRRLRLVTDDATYGGGDFAVAVQSER